MSEGTHALHVLRRRLDDLHAETHVPVTAQRTWLETWFDCQTQYRPVVVAVEEAGRVDAAAVLAVRRRLGVTQVVSAGHGLSDVTALPARSVGAAERLGAAVAGWLDGLGCGWRLSLRLVRATDVALDALAAHLRHGLVKEGDASPVLRACAGPSLRAYVGRSHWRQHRKNLNRMASEGLEPLVEHLTDPGTVAAVLDDVENVMRARDHAVGRRSIVDDPVGREFFRLLVERHSRDGGVCLTTLRLSGRLAAYALCFVDDGAYRYWNGRFDPSLGRLGVGTVATEEAVAHALEEGAREFDFMRGEEPYKSAYANDRLRTRDLFGWSGLVGAAGGRAWLSARDAVLRAERVDGIAARTLTAASRAAVRVTGGPR